MHEAWTNEETVMYTLALTPIDEASQETEAIEAEVKELKLPCYKYPVSLKWSILICLCLLLAMTTVTTILILLFNTTATVTIVRPKKSIAAQTIIVLKATHVFSTVSQSASHTAPATGTGHQDATYAHGSMTFFNALPAVQTIPSGTLLIGADGVHIITDMDAVIPAGNFAVNGQVSVPAHVMTLGASGNIPAGNFSDACCRDYVFARNNQFSGGQDTRDFRTVTQSDIEALTHSLTSQLDQQIQTDLLDQITPTQTLTTPLCSQTIVSIPGIGEEAEMVTVSVARTCSAASYKRSDLTAAVQSHFRRTIRMQLGACYIPLGLPQLTVINTSIKENMVRIIAAMNGTTVYQFRTQDIQQLKNLIAGKNRDRAVQLIIKWKDIRFIAIQMHGDQNTLPSNPNNITVRIE